MRSEDAGSSSDSDDGRGTSERPGTIRVWRPADLDGVELRRGTAVNRPVPRHWHEEYQLCLIRSGGGTISYRGSTLPTPPASLFLVHPGEVHSNRAPEGGGGCSYRDMFIAPERVRRAAADVYGSECDVPFFRTGVVADGDVVARYVAAHTRLEREPPSLETDELLLDLLARLVGRFAERHPPAGRRGTARRAVRRVCEYLADNTLANPRSEEIALVAGLSPYHLNRVFARELGMPPHAFQTQVRVLRAKELLRGGVSVAEVALRTGFFDQSHLTRHFTRVVGVPPGRYRSLTAPAKAVHAALRDGRSA